MEDCKAFPVLLFDTQSIQRYIYEGTKLRTNIGASYLIKSVFDTQLLPVLKDLFGAEEVDDTTWKETTEPDWTDQAQAVRIGYIGGGNALVIFRPDIPEQQRKNVVTQFTRRVLLTTPGLRTGAAFGTFHLDQEGHWQGDPETGEFAQLIHALKDGQNHRFPEVIPPYSGLTLACPVSGDPADAYDNTDGRFYSQGVEAKLRADDGETAPAEAALRKQLESVLPEEERSSFLQNYSFPREIEHLGQYETENYFAIVHIDGNNMGKQFAACHTLTERKNLSLSIVRKSLLAFTQLLQDMTSHFGEYYSFLKCDSDPHGKTYLPIRPVILGGDDLTFVCSAKIALHVTQFLMQRLDYLGIKSCGGIALLKTSYPFSRGYEMAEELCGAAKAVMRRTDNDSCWLDFALLHGEQPPALDALRVQEYTGVCSVPGGLHFGPYRVDETNTVKSLDKLIKAARWMKQLPQSRAKELRRVLAHGREEQRRLLAQMDYLRRSFYDDYSMLRLPDIPVWNAYAENLFVDGRTPYIDAIEIMDFNEPTESGSEEEEHA